MGEKPNKPGFTIFGDPSKGGPMTIDHLRALRKEINEEKKRLRSAFVGEQASVMTR